MSQDQQKLKGQLVPEVGATLGYRRILSDQKLAFIEAYCGSAGADPTRAAAEAGYKGKHGSLWKLGRELEQELAPQLEAELQRRRTRGIAQVDELLQELTLLSRGDSRDKLAAIRTMLEWYGEIGGKADRKALKSQLDHLLVEIQKSPSPIGQALGLLPAGSPQANTPE